MTEMSAEAPNRYEPAALRLDLPPAGCFGVDDQLRDSLVETPWGAHLRIPLPETDASAHAGTIRMINSWLENRFPLSMFEHEGFLRVSFAIDEPSTDNEELLATLAPYAAVAVNQPDLSEAEAWLAFSFNVASRYDVPAPLEERIQVQLQ